MLLAIFLKSQNLSSHQFNSKNNGPDKFCSLKLFLGTETVSCCLLQQIARIDMD